MSAGAGPRRRVSGSGRSRIGADLLWSVALFLFAVAVRIPNLLLIPEITDETEEVHEAIRIVSEGRWPLVAVDAYDGPLFIYLLSFVLRVGGFHLATPRSFSLVVGALTVVATFWLAREIARGDRRVAVLAASALAVNNHHVVYTSHLAFSNSMTPLFTTVCLCLYHRATRAGRPRLLVAAGGVFGLALQTHPSALALLPGLVLDYCLRRESRAQLRRPLPYVAAAAALTAYAPVLVHNALNGLDSLRVAERRSYAFVAHPSLGAVLSRLGRAVIMIGRTAVSSFGRGLAGGLLFVAFWTGAVLGFVTEVRRGERLQALVVGAALVFFAVFNRYYENPVAARYWMPLIPPLFVAAAGFVIRSGDEIGGGAATAAFPALMTLVVVFCSLAALRSHYRWTFSEGTHNGALLEIAGALREAGDDPIVVDAGLAQLRNRFAGSPLRGVVHFLELERREATVLSLATPADLERLKRIMRDHPRGFLVSFDGADRRLGREAGLERRIAGHFPCDWCGVPNDYALFSWKTRLQPSSRSSPRPVSPAQFSSTK